MEHLSNENENDNDFSLITENLFNEYLSNLKR